MSNARVPATAEGMSTVTRRTAFRSLAAGAATGALAAAGIIAATPAPAAQIITGTLAAAIKAHRAAVRHDESLYGEDCEPLVNAAALEASDAALAAALAAVAAAPCHTAEDVAAKVRHFLNGSVGLRGNDWSGEFLFGLWPNDTSLEDPAGPMVALLRSFDTSPHA